MVRPRSLAGLPASTNNGISHLISRVQKAARKKLQRQRSRKFVSVASNALAAMLFLLLAFGFFYTSRMSSKQSLLFERAHSTIRSTDRFQPVFDSTDLLPAYEFHRLKKPDSSPLPAFVTGRPYAIKSPLRIWIAGSSAAAGYGNLYRESYANLLVSLLPKDTDIFPTAMKDLTEFPSSWCFQPENANVVIYDFGEAVRLPHASRLEAFLRRIRSHNQLVIIRGLRTREHAELIAHYRDALNIVVIPDLVDVAGSFGVTGPDTLHSHNLSVEQHEATARLIALHLLACLDEKEAFVSSIMPEPLTQQWALPDNSLTWQSLLRSPQGIRLECRTSYEFAQYVSNQDSVHAQGLQKTRTIRPSDMASIIKAGLALPDETVARELLLLPKTDYSKGWVLDLDDRRSKLLSAPKQFWGHVDWKTAYYGRHTSGPLQLHIPAPVSFLVVCQNDRERRSTCRLDEHVRFSVPSSTQLDAIVMDDDAVSSLSGDFLCVQVHIPRMTMASLDLNITVRSYTADACSIANIIWSH